ncbi:phosphatase PAP2 family protein [Nakamurella sp. PAMC28650]|uniref:phosphatase PAP2 family protein n=1 Tax=Nakamurella sp. PAMC28650 TaxID=2762325 RepID=UPI00164D5908|nr:phosphatase PAP2 family protein [Nakamurella sp. PAMC28650]QNK82264.1 phosphatase PAP2 family protein [Nakamurella sp. PAMC28650]
MRSTDQAPPPAIVPAAVPMPPSIDAGLRGLTTAADHGVLWFGIAAVGVLAGGRARRAALRGAASLALSSFVANSVVKPLVGRRRPDPDRTQLARRIGKVPWTSSFPSGHSASAAAFATGAALELPLSATVLGPLAAAVAYSRVHVGVHYKSDAIVGTAIGAAIAVAGSRLWPVRPHGAAAMAPGDAPALPAGLGLTIVVNQASGTSDGAQEPLSKMLPQARIAVWDPENEDLSDLLGSDTSALGVAGGDGTVASVAQLAHAEDLPLAVFPYGTLNHFAKAMGISDAEQMAAAVVAGTARQVDVAMINGQVFLNTASIGGYPDLVRRRDRLSKRIGKWPAAGYALYRTLRHQGPMDLDIDGRVVPTWVVFIGNGIYRPRGLAPAWREDLATGVLDVQYLRADRALARTQAVVLSVLGLIERSRVFVVLEKPRLRITALSGPLATAHDGEVTDPVSEVDLSIDRRQLTVYH